MFLVKTGLVVIYSSNTISTPIIGYKLAYMKLIWVFSVSDF